MVKRTAGRVPADFADLAGGLTTQRVGIRLGLVVVVAGQRTPVGVNLSVERPVRNVAPVKGVGESTVFQRIGCKPTVAIPLPHRITDLRLGDLELEEALGTDRASLLLHRNERR